MSLLVFGQSGQVTHALARLSPEAVFMSPAQADLSDPAACAAAIRTNHRSCAAHAAINAAASTAVAAADAQETSTIVINADEPAAIATKCALLGLPSLTILTDYVFDSSDDALWTPEAPASTLDAYGRSHLSGERCVCATGAHKAILRKSWVFSSDWRNFPQTMLRMSETRDAISIVADQIGGPTPAEDVARDAITISQPMLIGHSCRIWHDAGAPMSVGPNLQHGYLLVRSGQLP